MVRLLHVFMLMNTFSMETQVSNDDGIYVDQYSDDLCFRIVFDGIEKFSATLNLTTKTILIVNYHRNRGCEIPPVPVIVDFVEEMNGKELNPETQDQLHQIFVKYCAQLFKFVEVFQEEKVLTVEEKHKHSVLHITDDGGNAFSLDMKKGYSNKTYLDIITASAATIDLTFPKSKILLKPFNQFHIYFNILFGSTENETEMSEYFKYYEWGKTNNDTSIEIQKHNRTLFVVYIPQLESYMKLNPFKKTTKKNDQCQTVEERQNEIISAKIHYIATTYFRNLLKFCRKYNNMKFKHPIKAHDSHEQQIEIEQINIQLGKKTSADRGNKTKVFQLAAGFQLVKRFDGNRVYQLENLQLEIASKIYQLDGQILHRVSHDVFIKKIAETMN